MIYFTGDTHGGIDMQRFTSKNMKMNNIHLTKNDFLIIAGDFGFPFYDRDREKGSRTNGEYRFWTRFMSDLPCTFLFVEGNHDNHPFWNAQPVNGWHGGRVHFHPDIPNCIHLMRGEMYTDIEGKSLFAFGGAASTDTEPVYDETGRCIWSGRTEGKDWWREETASEEDIGNALANLEKAGYKADIVVTHTPPHHIMTGFFGEDGVVHDPTAEFFDTLDRLEYKVWVSGHIHKDWKDRRLRMIGLYRTIIGYDECLTNLSCQ